MAKNTSFRVLMNVTIKGEKFILQFSLHHYEFLLTPLSSICLHVFMICVCYIFVMVTLSQLRDRYFETEHQSLLKGKRLYLL